VKKVFMRVEEVSSNKKSPQAFVTSMIVRPAFYVKYERPPPREAAFLEQSF
jgi:hypothetical protein